MLAYSKDWVIVAARTCTRREAQKEGIQGY